VGTIIFRGLRFPGVCFVVNMLVFFTAFSQRVQVMIECELQQTCTGEEIQNEFDACDFVSLRVA